MILDKNVESIRRISLAGFIVWSLVLAAGAGSTAHAGAIVTLTLKDQTTLRVEVVSFADGALQTRAPQQGKLRAIPLDSIVKIDFGKEPAWSTLFEIPILEDNAQGVALRELRAALKQRDLRRFDNHLKAYALLYDVKPLEKLKDELARDIAAGDKQQREIRKLRVAHLMIVSRMGNRGQAERLAQQLLRDYPDNNSIRRAVRYVLRDDSLRPRRPATQRDPP